MRTLEQELSELANPEKAKLLQGFFKTGKGDYGEGDVFLGVMVPQTRAIAKQFQHLGLEELEKSLHSKYHEERLSALLILVEKFRKASGAERKRLFDFYLTNTAFINNWDLVDLTAHKIVGEFLLGKGRGRLYTLAKSKSVWERRIAIISTFAFIREGDLKDCLEISGLLLDDRHDLIHKATGWALREAGKKDIKALRAFLKAHAAKMPRTMLRYAIERMPERERRKWLSARTAIV